MKNNLLIWDLETSGLDFASSKVLEIGALIVDKSGNKTEKRWLLDNKIDIPKEASDINGITNEVIEKEGKDPKKCLLEFLPHFKDCDVNITHNGIKFDIPFLIIYTSKVLNFTEEEKQELYSLVRGTAYDTAVPIKSEKIGLKIDKDESFIAFAERVMSVRAYGVLYNLAICCDELGIDRSKVVQHRALSDVYLTHLVYESLQGRQIKN